MHGRTYAPDVRDRDNSINRLVVSPNFFDVMGIPVLAGRGFSERDSDTAPKVVMINQAAATKYFPNENPVGQRIGSNLENAGQLEIVGVLRDVEVQQRPRCGPADDVRALHADADRQRGVRGADRGRSRRP